MQPSLRFLVNRRILPVRSKANPTWNLSPRNSRKTNDSPSDRYASHHIYGLVICKGHRGFDVRGVYVEPMPIGRCDTVEKIPQTPRPLTVKSFVSQNDEVDKPTTSILSRQQGRIIFRMSRGPTNMPVQPLLCSLFRFAFTPQ